MPQKNEKKTGKFASNEVSVPKELLFKDIPEDQKITKSIQANEQSKSLSFEQKGIPVYIVALLVVLALVAGFAGFSLLNKPVQPIINTPIDNNPSIDTNFVKIISVYSSNCIFCEKDSTLILSFQSRNVKMQIEYVDIESMKGKQLLELYSIDSLPTTLVEESTIKNYPAIFASLKGQKLENGFFVFPEFYLDKKPHNKMFLETKEPLSGTGKATLSLFLDYTNMGSYTAFKKTKELKTKFGEDLNIVFRNFVLGGDESERIAIASECAKLQGNQKQLDFINRAFFYKYEDPSRQGADQNKAVELFPSDVLKIGRDIGDNNSFSLDDFIECFGAQKTKSIVHSPSQYDEDKNVGTDNLAAVNTYVVGFVPAFIIDNQFVTYNVGKIEEQLCSVRKELAACKQ